MTLQHDGFSAFFEEVTGKQPFPWQLRLAGELLDGTLPDLIDVPTGLGKTSVILAWVYALAATMEDDRLRPTLPLRLFYVVDRRIIVDSTYDLAARLAGRFQEAVHAGPATAAVAQALAALAGAGAPPLAAVRMRGGATWDARWLDRPHQPAVVVSTVDQFGSRLLFRGYGVSASMLPLNAALCGMDGWVVVDEAHIAEPLAETVQRIRSLQRPETGLGLRPLHVTLMSATVRARAANTGALRATLQTEASGTSPAELEARKRLAVSKPARLLEVSVTGKGAERNRQLGKKLAEELLHLAADRGKFALLCNTVQAARSAFELAAEKRPGAVSLLTGRVREFERSRLVPEVVNGFASGSPAAQEPLLLVATQTIEVGADLDFDAIVTECAPLASLIQRFGRVRRTGNSHPATSAVVYARGLHEDDALYGPATTHTWQLLNGLATNSAIDFSFQGVAQLKAAANPHVTPAPPHIPVLLGAHLERFAQTSPIPVPDQPVAPFLHGIENAGPPQVYIAWRAIPQPPAGGTAAAQAWWAEWLNLAPIADWETVAVPLSEARAFVAGIISQETDADVEFTVTSDATLLESREAPNLARAAILPGSDEPPQPVQSPLDLQPNVLLIIDSFEGGHDRWGWTGRRANSPQDAVPDVADLTPSRGRRSIRVAPSIPSSHNPEAASEILEAWAQFNPENPAESLPGVLSRWADIVPEPLASLYRTAAEGIRQGTWAPYLPERSPLGEWSVADHGRPPVRVVERASSNTVSPDQSDDDEISTSLTGRVPIPLTDHSERVGALARDFARRIGLPDHLVRAVELAGRFHDIGKAEPRFQVALYDGDSLAPLTGGLRAKSGLDPRDPVARRAHRLAGLPPGFRHEAVSARLLRKLAELSPATFHGVDLELVAHLVAAHHGRARPLLPPLNDPAAPPTRLTLDGIELEVPGQPYQVEWTHPATFEELNRRYGWWGLALLETIVRLADMKDSELSASQPAAAAPTPAAAQP